MEYVLDLRHGDVRLSGIQHGAARIVARGPRHIVIAFAGWGENPGSRYSGLRAYYPAETKVYEIISGIPVLYPHESPKDLFKVVECVSWQTRTRKGKQGNGAL